MTVRDTATTPAAAMSDDLVRDLVLPFVAAERVTRAHLVVETPARYHGLRYVTVQVAGSRIGAFAYVVDLVLGGVYPVRAADSMETVCGRVVTGIPGVA